MRVTLLVSPLALICNKHVTWVLYSAHMLILINEKEIQMDSENGDILQTDACNFPLKLIYIFLMAIMLQVSFSQLQWEMKRCHLLLQYCKNRFETSDPLFIMV